MIHMSFILWSVHNLNKQNQIRHGHGSGKSVWKAHGHAHSRSWATYQSTFSRMFDCIASSHCFTVLVWIFNAMWRWITSCEAFHSQLWNRVYPHAYSTLHTLNPCLTTAVQWSHKAVINYRLFIRNIKLMPTRNGCILFTVYLNLCHFNVVNIRVSTPCLS